MEGSAASSSLASFALPGLRTVRRRFLKTGTALETTGRSSARNGARFLVAGFAVSTSGSRSSSAARRLTNVVLAWRKTGGSCCSVWSKATFWLAIAWKALVALEMPLVSCVVAAGDRGRELRRADDEAFEEVLVGVQFADEGVGPVEARAEVFVGEVGVGPAAGVDRGAALDELFEAAADFGREGVEELVEVGGRRRRGEPEGRAFVERRFVVGPGADRDVVVGDAGEGGRADHRGRAFVQLLFGGDLDFGEVVVGEADAFDRADRLAADQDLVVGDELARVLEEQRVLVFAAAAEEDHAEGDDDHREGRDRRRAGGGDPPARRRAFLLAFWICGHGSSLAALIGLRSVRTARES